jgi:hypothetical protein
MLHPIPPFFIQNDPSCHMEPSFLGSHLACGASFAQTATAPGLAIIEGQDADSGLMYARITLPAEQASGAADSPALTVQCSQLNSRKKIDLYFDFGGVDRSFHAPEKPDPVTHLLPANPSVRLRLTFEGYKPFNRTWEVMPWGEYRYRQPGVNSPNLDTVQFFLAYMYSVPVLHMTFTEKKASGKTAEFHTSGLIAEMKKNHLCNP